MFNTSDKITSLAGKIFGEITVMGRVPRVKSRKGWAMWETICVCGKKEILDCDQLRNRQPFTCPCIKNQSSVTLLSLKMELTGKTIGWLSVRKGLPNNKYNKAMFETWCEKCNKKGRTVRATDLRLRKKYACITCTRLIASTKRKSQGDTSKASPHHRLYKRYYAIRNKCYNQKISTRTDRSFYQQKGITMCDEWIADYIKFKEWALSNGWTPDHYIIRENKNKGFSPENCVISETLKLADESV